MAKSKVRDINIYQYKPVSDRVAEYINCEINGGVIRKRMQGRIEDCVKQIRYHEKNFSGEEPIKMFTKEESAVFAAKFRQELAELKEALADQLKAEALFALTKGDEALYANYRKLRDEEELRKAIAQWFLPYTPEWADPVTQDTPFVCNLAQCLCAQERNVSGMKWAYQLANDKELTLTKGMSKKEFLGLFYRKLAQCIIGKIPGFVKALSPDEKALFQKKQSETAETAQA